MNSALTPARTARWTVRAATDYHHYALDDFMTHMAATTARLGSAATIVARSHTADQVRTSEMKW